MAWTTFELTVTTPLFNGDSPDTGLRVASVRGVMHHWFRTLAATRAGNDLTALSRAEQAVFGSTKRASPVRMRLTKQPAGESLVPAGDTEILAGGRKKWVGYLLGQGLAEYDSGTGLTHTTRPYTDPGHRFELRIGFSGDEAVDSLFLASLWLSCTYGGFGARTRKGMGGVRLTYVEGPLPGPWNGSSPDTPGLEHYRGLTHLPVDGALADCTELLERVMPTPRSSAFDRAPDYPALGPAGTVAALGRPASRHWRDVADEVGLMYRGFRASRPHPHTKKPYNPKIKTPEHVDVMIRGGGDFPLGALGLPVNYQKDGLVNVFQGGEQARRASPLWLRFVGAEKEEQRLFSFAFLNPFLPERSGARVRVRGGRQDGERVRVSDGDVLELAARWLNLTREDPEPSAG